MDVQDHVVGAGFRLTCALAALIVAVPVLSAQAETSFPQRQAAVAQVHQARPEAGFDGPSFRKGLWRFVRTLDVVRDANKNVKYRMVDREMTRCVDPTQAMKATFSTAPVGSCVSDKPEKVGNKYTFAHRCDYLGAVSTVITVQSDAAYTEVNEVREGDHPKTDLVVATRIGDCGDETTGDLPASSVSSLQH